MASRILNPSLFHLRLAPTLVAGVSISTALLFPQLLQPFRSRPLRLDASPTPTGAKDWSFSQYQADARTPVVTKDGRLNASAVRQMSAGSILGLVAGLGVSLFSKPLAVLIGLVIVGVQTAESYGIHLVPYRRLQGYVTSVDLRSAVQDNIAFKICFGAMFALSGFAEF